MYSEILKYIFPKTPWKYQNINNIYNLLIVTYSMIPDNQKKEFISNIKLIVGLNFLNDFKLYLFSKDQDNEMLLILK